MSDRETRLERMIGAVILPEFRPAGGESPGAPERRPSGAYLRRFPPAGLIGFGRRMPDGLRIDGLERLTRELVQSANGASGLAPFVCADLECGAGYHLPGASLLPPARALAAAEAILPGAVEAASELTGREARAAGIDLVLAPVLDVNTNPANPIIGVRAFGRTVDEVTAMGRASIAGLHRAGAGACIKHYPGHGSSLLDSHKNICDITRSHTDEESHVFRDLIKSYADQVAVMSGHLMHTKIDQTLPASLSRAHTTHRLRDELGFDGVVITDSLDMRAIRDNFGEGESAILAINAGADLILDGLNAPGFREPKAPTRIAHAICGAITDGRIRHERARIEKSRNRIDRFVRTPNSD